MSEKSQGQKLKEKISKCEATVETRISRLGRTLNGLLGQFEISNQAKLMRLGCGLRDALIQRYLWQEAIYDSQIYYEITLKRRIQFAQVLQSNTKVVRQHYYSNCIHYLPEKSDYELAKTLEFKLKLLISMRKQLEKFDCRILAELLRISEATKADVKRSLKKLLVKTDKQNRALEALQDKLARKTKRREDKIARMEGEYFATLADKLHSEKWMSQTDIRKKVDLLRVQPVQRRRRICIQCNPCGWRGQRRPSTKFEFTLQKDQFKHQVENILK